MKILYFHQHFSTPKGSTGTRSYSFAKRLINRGHSVSMVCGSYWIASSGLKGKFINGKREGKVDGINVIELKIDYSNKDNYFSRIISFLAFSFRGIKIAIYRDYDIIFATSTPLTAGIPGIFAKYLKNKKFVFEVRDLWPELPKAMGVIKNPIILKLMDFLETVSYKSADGIIGLAPGIVSGIRKKVPNKNIVMIPNGCDNNLIKKKNNFQSRNKFIATFTGAHGFANGLNIILDAAKIIQNLNESDIEIHFIGDGAVKESLQKRAERENIENCIFLEPLSKKKLFKYLNDNVSVGLMTLKNIPEFYYGTSPNKFFDYISLGLPVLNNYPGWIADIIRRNNCGLVVDPDNPKAFADALIYLKLKPHLLNEMSANGMALSKKKFDRSILSDSFVKFIEGIN